jgi:hypothetical protein
VGATPGEQEGDEPDAGAGGAGDTDLGPQANYYPDEPPYYDLVFSEAAAGETYLAITQTVRPGFVLSHALTDEDWQPGPGRDIWTGDPTADLVTWGDTSVGVDKPALVLSLYYERKTVTIALITYPDTPATSLLGVYGSPLFDDENPERRALLRPEKVGQRFLGWYTYPQALTDSLDEPNEPEGELRVDDPEVTGYWESFPANDIFLYAHWTLDEAEEETDEGETPEQDGLVVAPDHTSPSSGATNAGASAGSGGQAGEAPEEGANTEGLAEDDTASTIELHDPEAPLTAFGLVDIPLVALPEQMAFSLADLFFTALGLGLSTLLVLGFLFRRLWGSVTLSAPLSGEATSANAFATTSSAPSAPTAASLNLTALIFSRGFACRAVAMGLGLVQLAICIGTQDLSMSPVIFDAASIPTLTAFAVQVLLFTLVFLDERQERIRRKGGAGGGGYGGSGRSLYFEERLTSSLPARKRSRIQQRYDP